MQPAKGDHYKALGLPRASRLLYRSLRGPYSIRELAHQLECDGDTIRQWEQGISRPSLPLLRQLVDHYLLFAGKYGRDPLRLLQPTRRPSARGAQGEKPVGMAGGASVRAAKPDRGRRSPRSSAPPPSLAEGGAEKMGDHGQGE